MSDGTRNRVLLLADGQTLTSSFADTSTIGEFDCRGAAQITIYVDYQRGQGEGASFMEFQVFTSVDGGTTYHPEGEWDDTDNSAVTPEGYTFKIVDSDGIKPSPLIKPINGLKCKIQIREQNFISNAGTATIRVLLRYV